MKLLKLFTIYIFLFSSLYAEDWETHWIKAVEFCDNKNYTEAEQEFTQAIKCLEEDKDTDHPHVYVDRARLYCLQNKFEEALTDVNIGLNSEKLIENDRVRGIVTRLCIYSNLNMEQEFIKDYETFREISIDFPKIEFTDSSVIIRNAPKSSCYRKITKAFLINSGICEKENDIKELSNGIIIAKRVDLCECECKVRGNPNNKQVAKQVEDCKWWCDKNMVAASLWCGKVFKTWGCQASCIAACEVIKEGCYWCCRNGNFYEDCLKPFGDIVGQMGNTCDPYWD